MRVQWDIQDIIRSSFYKEYILLRATSFRKIQWVELSPEITEMSYIYHELKMIPLYDVHLRKKMSGGNET